MAAAAAEAGLRPRGMARGPHEPTSDQPRRRVGGYGANVKREEYRGWYGDFEMRLS